MKLKVFFILFIIGVLAIISCKDKVICNYYIVGNEIYNINDSLLKWKINKTNPTSYYKFGIEEKIPAGFAIPDYSELKVFVDEIKNCKQIDLPVLFPSSIKLISNTDTIDYEGNKMLKGFVFFESDGIINIKEVTVDKGELVTILFKKL